MSVTRLYDSDLLDLSPQVAHVIAQQCNCISKTAKGLSASVIKKFPHADFYTDRSGPSSPGRIKLAGSKGGGRIVVAMFAQYRPGKPKKGDTSDMRETWFEECLGRIGKIKGLRSIAFPDGIGCGLGGGAWDNYNAMIENFAKDHAHINVIVCSQKPRPPTAAEQELVLARNMIDKALGVLSDLNYSTNKCGCCDFWCHTGDVVFRGGDCPDCYTPESSDSGSDNSGSGDSDSGSPDPECSTLEMYAENTSAWSEFFSGVAGSHVSLISDHLQTKETVEVFPPIDRVFAAFESCEPDDIKVIILGQDPYHTPGAANGLAFSHNDDVAKIQPSLRNIYKELESDGFAVNPSSGDLSKWAAQGVFLINTALTVRKGEANSHKSLWKPFTKELLKYLASKCLRVVVIAWGTPAKKLAREHFFADGHVTIESVHPSPLSAHGGFFGSKPFSRTNEILRGWSFPIDWSLA